MLSYSATCIPVPALSRRQRTWIALYSLDAGHRDRAEVLQQNNVTEADLTEFEESWLQMRCRLDQ
ncbi:MULTISPECIES: hypothetical protein [Hymenobacter]|uniref:Uncharacterized protein n=1 Tax=Hymenobacter latericoloratus TaxID=1411121 RepID=A0ABR6JYG2_9BACT|nr:hypothetical protein [Hymenobacter latericoloratus]MBB4601877.1 hypothetical protein [Hymenobacter latericoloratus]